MDKHGDPQAVLTGSTNWTSTAICAQSNNALICQDPNTAAAYLTYWQRIKADAGHQAPGYRSKNDQAVDLKSIDANPVVLSKHEAADQAEGRRRDAR